jgi:hypothetical protein
MRQQKNRQRISKENRMSKVQTWAFGGIAAIALAAGALLATGAVTSAQTSDPTPTPAATDSSGDATPTPAPTDSNSDDSGSGNGKYDDANCPNMGDENSSDSSSSSSSSFHHGPRNGSSDLVYRR